MELQDWLFVVTAAAAVGQVGALIALILQLKDFRRQTRFTTQATRDSTRMNVWLEMLAIDRFFCEHPELRQQFYGPSNLHTDPMKAQQLAAASEMLLDFAECMMTQKRHLHHGFDGWRGYFGTLFAQSPVLRKFWQENEQWFQEDMRQAVNTVLDDIAKQSKTKAGTGKKRAAKR